MADEVHLHQGGTIGASEGLSKFILSNDEILEDAVFRLQGYTRVRSGDGQYEIILLRDRTYNKKCVAWMKGKLQEVLNKNMSLSNLPREDVMLGEGRNMGLSFCRELWNYWKDFELDPDRYDELCNMYSNYLSQAIRAPYQEGTRRFLSSTHSESVQTVRQTISDTQEKKGLLGGLLGR